MKNIRGIYNLLQTQNTFFILDTRDAKNFDELNIRKSVNVPVTSSEKRNFHFLTKSCNQFKRNC